MRVNMNAGCGMASLNCKMRDESSSLRRRRDDKENIAGSGQNCDLTLTRWDRDKHSDWDGMTELSHKQWLEGGQIKNTFVRNA